VYYEAHHIIPRALGGSDNPENLVLLTEREHYLCHRLLVRMTEGKPRAKMASAFRFMVFGPNTRQKRFPSSSQYTAARQMARLAKHPEAIAKMAATLTGRTLTEEHKANISRNNARTMAKTFDVIDPSGNRTTIHNLRLWCQEHDFKYQNAYLSAKLGRVCRNKGPMQGYQFFRL
jgi:5-methylcytosine-specific restriction endonuclease McrA